MGAAVDVRGSSVVLAGRTGGDWAAVNAGGGSDFAVVKLRADDGSELWRFQVCQRFNVLEWENGVGSVAGCLFLTFYFPTHVCTAAVLLC